MERGGARCCLLAACGAAWLQGAAAAAASGGTLNLLQWNPHWQCFAWNQKDCKGHVEALVGQYLQRRDVDFANVVELEDEGYKPPAQWPLIASTKDCTTDVTSLIYNSARWKAAAGANFSRTGCMDAQESSRPFVIQVFESVADSGAKIIVAGAHFPHPDGFGQHLSDAEAAPLRTALADVMTASGVQSVVVIADTNEYSSTASSVVAKYLSFPEGEVVSTDLEVTCCADVKFQSWGTFDRIITSFGSSMKTEVLIQQPIPDWAQQEKGGKVGAFHLPIMGTLTWAPTTTSRPPASGLGRGAIIGIAAAAVAGAALAAALVVALVRRRRRSLDVREIQTQLTV